MNGLAGLRRVMVVLVVALVMALTAACDSGGSASGGGSTETGLGTGATLRLVNGGADSICFVYISLPTDADWGEDKLGEFELIEAGDMREFAVAPGTYDLRAEVCNGGAFEEARGFAINGTAEWEVSP